MSLAERSKSAENQYGEHAVCVCSPTAKASVRVNEFLKSIGAAARAGTIHRTLQARRDAAGWRFNFNEHNHLPHQVIVVDESSMISTDLMAALLAARRPGARVLLVGDTFQLPPVGHGKPMWDLLNHIPVAELTEIHRNAGTIVQACHAIKDGATNFPVVERLNIDERQNLRFQHAKDDGAVIDAVVKLLHDVQAGTRFDVTNDAIVLCATNAVRETINERLQAEFNRDGESATGNKFRVGDPIICRRNQWRRDLDRKQDVYLANGEIGIALEVAPTKTIIQFKSPVRRVTIPLGKSKDEDNPSAAFHLAYAITGHSSQGSQWPLVIVVLEDSFNARRVAGRSWLYTSISRASRACVLVGKRSTAAQMVQRVGIESRKTFLSELLQNELSDG